MEKNMKKNMNKFVDGNVNKKEFFIKKYIDDINTIKNDTVKSSVLTKTQFDNIILLHYLNLNDKKISDELEEVEDANTNFIIAIKKNCTNTICCKTKQTTDNDNDVVLDKTVTAATTTKSQLNIVKYLWNLIKNYIPIFMCIILLVIYKHETSNLFMRNIQNYIYPGMKYWRKLTIPIIKTFPELTQFYDETCLLQNPLFQVEQLDCTPCMNIINVLDLTNNYVENAGSVPYIFKINAKQIDLKLTYELYKENKNVFKSNSYKVQSTNENIKNLDNLFFDFLNNTQNGHQQQQRRRQRQRQQQESHNLWRINRMQSARILRQLYKCPKRLPSTGQSVERFLAIDTPFAISYKLPDTDCSNIFIIQTFGARTIVLRPTNECKTKCRTITVRLPESYVLNYDWWYWKPISLPDQLPKSPSISYIVSYC